MRETQATWTIDDLARRAGMTVRNIRAHQSRGLLPAPVVRGRTGFYGPEHEERIALIQRLQAEGFNLEAIRRIVDAGPGPGDAPLTMLRTLAESYGNETPEPVTIAELDAHWGPDGPAQLQRALELGVLRRTEDGGFEYPSPGLVRAARQVAALGIPLARQLDLVEQMRGQAAGIATGLVELFVEQIWHPFVQAGSPQERWPEVAGALERVQPLVGEVLWSVFATAMDEAVEQALGRELRDLAERA